MEMAFSVKLSSTIWMEKIFAKWDARLDHRLLHLQHLLLPLHLPPLLLLRPHQVRRQWQTTNRPCWPPRHWWNCRDTLTCLTSTWSRYMQLTSTTATSSSGKAQSTRPAMCWLSRSQQLATCLEAIAPFHAKVVLLVWPTRIRVPSSSHWLKTKSTTARTRHITKCGAIHSTQRNPTTWKDGYRLSTSTRTPLLLTPWHAGEPTSITTRRLMRRLFLKTSMASTQTTSRVLST